MVSQKPVCSPKSFRCADIGLSQALVHWYSKFTKQKFYRRVEENNGSVRSEYVVLRKENTLIVGFLTTLSKAPTKSDISPSAN